MGFCIEGGGSIALISPCVIDILRTAFSALFVVIFLHRSYQLHFSADTYNSFAYEETDMIFKFKYVFFIVSCILAVLSIAFAFDDTGNRSSVALLLTSLMVALAHASSALCMRLEAKKIESWPSLHLKFYYSISFALNLVDCAVNYSSTLDFIESVVSTFLALILVVSFVIKDVFFIDYTENDHDSHKDQRSFPNDVRYSSLIENEENVEEVDAFERSRSDERFSFSGSLDYFRLKLKSFTSPPHNPNSSSLNDSSHNPYLEDLLLAESGQEKENSFSSSRSASNAKTNSRTLTYSSSGPPVVLSALDKSLVSTDYSSNQSTPVKSPSSSDSRRDRTPKSAGNNSSSNSNSNNSINNNSNNSPSSPSRSSANNGSGGSNKLDSGALQRALLLQKSKQQLQQNLPSESSLNKTTLKSINTADSHVASPSTNTSPSSSSGDLLVSVHRWGIRRKNEGSNNSNSNSSSNSSSSSNSNRSSMGASTKPKSPLKNASNTTFDADDDDYDDEFDAGEASLDLFGGTVPSPSGSHNGHTEVEFEICVALGSNSGYSMSQDVRSSNMSASSSFIGNTSMKMSEQEWWGLGRANGDQEGVRSSAFNSSSSKKTNGGKWVVWKTSGDVISLHVSLVNLLGDAAPKRPKLKSAMFSLDGLNSGSTNISMSRHELSDDMRSISFYLNNLLRGLLSNGTHAGLQLIYSFLKINNPDYLQSHSNANLPGSFQLTDNTPIEKKSLKGNDSDVSQNETSLFSIEAAKVENQSIHQRQEKWRKLFVSMRMALKPGEITVKCRLFEGVVSGESIAAWLMSPDSKMGTTSSSTNTATTSSSTADIAMRSNNVRTVQEACAIAQELLICGLLVPVSYGYLDDGAQFSDPSFNYSSALVIDTSSPTSLQQQQQPPPPPFFYLYGYIYRFGEKAGSSSIGGSRIQCTVFGAPCLVRISEWSHAESSDDINEGIGGGGRDSMNMGRQSEVFMVNSSGKEAKGHIEYLVQASHGGDSWRTWKRYREFEQLQRGLVKEGIDITASLPSKTMGRSINNHTIIESRRVGLETFLKSALDAAIRSGSLEAMQICALFLDEDHKKLRSYFTES